LLGNRKDGDVEPRVAGLENRQRGRVVTTVPKKLAQNRIRKKAKARELELRLLVVFGAENASSAKAETSGHDQIVET
jgi:hypothetical protein